jgi:DNA-binding MarR family transcriptional regulator
MSLQSLGRKPGHLIRRCQQIAVSVFLEECAAWDITPVQYAILSALEDNRAVEQIRLAGLVAVDRSTMGTVLGRLEARGLVARRADARDGRVRLVSLTARGRRLLAGMEAAVARAQRRIAAPLDAAERRTLMRLLGRIAEGNNERSRAPARRT